MRSSKGITLIELLIAGAILLVLIGSLGSLLVSSSRAYEANRAVSSASGQLRSAVQAIQYDVALAGFCGVQAECEIVDALSVTFSEVDGRRVIDSIEVAYTENRYVAAEAVQRVRYQVDGASLVRSVGGATPVAIADGILGIDLLGYRSAADTSPQLRFQRPNAGELAGIDLRLRYQQGQGTRTEDFTIALQNRL